MEKNNLLAIKLVFSFFLTPLYAMDPLSAKPEKYTHEKSETFTESVYEVSDFSKTHKPHHNLETKETIYYPNIYADYESFQNEYVTKLLAERLKLLHEFKDLHSKWMIKKMLDSEYESLKFELESNEIAILTNCKTDVLQFIFGKNYDPNCIQTNHITSVAISLKNRLLGQSFNETQTKLDRIIEALQTFDENEGQFFAIGKKSFLSLRK
jgi:hypothetical protein